MELMIEGITPMHTTFETGKEKIRNAISDIAERATSFEEFQRLLKAEYGISVKDHRGRFSYLPADRQKYISARALGSNYDRDRLLHIFAENARTAEQNNPHWGANDPMVILFIKSDLRLVVDLQTCVKAQQSRAYAQKVKISNLQQMARTVAYVQEHGYDSYEKLSETAEAIYFPKIIFLTNFYIESFKLFQIVLSRYCRVISFFQCLIMFRKVILRKGIAGQF